ncbi:hypothetical protein LCL97_24210 [Seohaeicola saemankumensis]|nr:lectin-like protein [Seohaeicola saemankumensis]MCA0873941.1 hypothetical protein [Seohaeicola saemankumensis]
MIELAEDASRIRAVEWNETRYRITYASGFEQTGAFATPWTKMSGMLDYGCADTGLVRVTVTDCETGLAIPGAKISLAYRGANVTGLLPVNDAGRGWLKPRGMVLPAVLEVLALADGYLITRLPLRIDGTSIVEMTLCLRPPLDLTDEPTSEAPQSPPPAQAAPKPAEIPVGFARRLFATDPVTGHAYASSESAATWPEAEQHCRAAGGHLATITSARENAFLVETFNTDRELWLGGTDDTPSGQWEWVTGEPWDYTNWNLPDEPNDFHGGEYYLQYDWGGTWNDLGRPGGSDRHGFLCEWEPEAQTQAAAAPPPAPQAPAPEPAAAPAPPTAATASPGSGQAEPGTIPNPASVPVNFQSGRRAIDPRTGHAYASTAHDIYTWPEAEAHCRSEGGHLATVTSIKENAFLVEEFEPNRRLWLGARTEPVVGRFEWVTGEAFFYGGWGNGKDLPWQDGRPARTEDPSRELHLLFHNDTGYAHSGVWYDHGHHNAVLRIGALCEWEPRAATVAAVPAPAQTPASATSVHNSQNAIPAPPSDAPSNEPGPAEVPPGFVSIRTYIDDTSGHAYAVHEDRLNWPDAEALCRRFGGHLATVTSPQENQIMEDGFDGFRPWLGAMKTAANQWQWVTGEAWQYENWDTDEPDLSGAYLRQFSYVRWGSGGAPGSTGRTHVLCEWEPKGATALPAINKATSRAADPTPVVQSAPEPVGEAAPVVRERVLPDGAILNTATGHAYRMSSDQVTWREAMQSCRAEGGHLATITSAEENTFVAAHFDGNRRIWLGGTDARIEGRWEWITGEPFSFMAFDEDEPNDSDGGEDYLELGEDGRWNDDGLPKRDRDFFYLCEWEPEAGAQVAPSVTPAAALPRVVLAPKKPKPGGANVSPPPAAVPAEFPRAKSAVAGATGSAFAVTEQALNWHEAAEMCQRHGGHLATVTSRWEARFISQAFSGDPLWLGGALNAKTGQWLWITNERWGVTSWNEGEPVGANTGEDYLVMRADGRWTGADRLDSPPRLPGLCEWESEFE